MVSDKHIDLHTGWEGVLMKGRGNISQVFFENLWKPMVPIEIGSIGFSLYISAL